MKQYSNYEIIKYFRSNSCHLNKKKCTKKKIFDNNILREKANMKKL